MPIRSLPHGSRGPVGGTIAQLRAQERALLARLTLTRQRIAWATTKLTKEQHDQKPAPSSA